MTDRPQLDQINLVVTDMEATVRFYRRLGLDIPDTDPTFQHHHRFARLPGEIDFDIDSVEFARHWDKGWRSGAGVLGFKFASREEVDAVYADLTSAGYRGQQEPLRRLLGCSVRNRRGSRWQCRRTDEPDRSEPADRPRLSGLTPRPAEVSPRGT